MISMILQKTGRVAVSMVYAEPTVFVIDQGEQQKMCTLHMRPS